MAQEFAKVYVKHVTGGAQHDVVVVAITDAEDVGRNAATGAGVDKVLRCLQRF